MISYRELEVIQNEINNEKVIYEWDAIYPHIGGLNGGLFRFICSFGACILLSVSLSYYMIARELYLMSFLSFCTLMLVSCVSYFIVFADHKCLYKITKKGIITSSQQCIPESVYKFIRGFAWIGAGVCIVGVIIIGPFAFIGAGVFGLMSFFFINFSPKTNNINYVFLDNVKVYDIYKENFIFFICHPYMVEASSKLYYNDIETKNKILHYLGVVLDNPELDAFPTEDEALKDEFYYTALVEEPTRDSKDIK